MKQAEGRCLRSDYAMYPSPWLLMPAAACQQRANGQQQGCLAASILDPNAMYTSLHP
jgi:hypothetical protein